MSRYREVGKLAAQSYELLDDRSNVIGGGANCEPIWGCVDCGAIVFLRGNHDQWHTLNDTPLSSVLAPLSSDERPYDRGREES